MTLASAPSRWPSLLAVVAAALGALALVIRKPPARTEAVVDVARLADEVERGADHITVAELRELVGKKGARVIDLRTPAEYAAGHVPDAENVELRGLAALSIRKDEPLVLYSEGGIHSAQAWLLLRARGATNVRFLTGGFDEWREATEGRAPSGAGAAGNVPPAPVGGSSATASGGLGAPASAAASSATPKVAPVSAVAPSPRVVAPRPRKAREGC